MLVEKKIEKILVNAVAAAGGVAYKFNSLGRRSVPDRLILLPGGRVVFAECKAPGKKPTPAQALEHARLKRLGFDVLIIDSIEGALNAWVR